MVAEMFDLLMFKLILLRMLLNVFWEPKYLQLETLSAIL